MTENKKTNKKVIVGLAALAVLIAVFAGIFFLLREKPVTGSKNVVIEVMGKTQEKVNYTVKTEAEFLRQAMDEAEGLSYGDTDGFINTINGETADYSVDGSYWAIYVNGEYGMYGINEQPVMDGDIFLFQYTADFTE